MQPDFAPLIHIDWKTPGGELLELFRHYYPDISVFSGPTFERLLDELTTQMPEVCLQALAPLLARQGLELWNLDAGGDDYRPVIIPADQRQAFIEHWQHSEDELELTPQWIEPHQPAPIEAKPAKTRSKKLNLLQDVHDFPGPTYINEHHYSNGWASITEQDDEQWLCFLLDFNQWPPAEQDMLEERNDNIDGADLWLLDANNDRSLWKRRVYRGSGSGEDLFQYEIRQDNDTQRFGPAQLQWPEFENAPLVIDSQVFERQYLYEPDRLCRIWRITADSSEIIFEHPGEMTILAIGPRRVLFMEMGGPLCWIWHQDQPQQVTPAQPLPVEGYKLTRSAVYLGGDEIMLFSESQRPNLEDPRFGETVLNAWRFDFLSGQATQSMLDGFGSEIRQQTQMLVTQPKRTVTLRTFHGQIHASRGHGDWWVWNYRSNSFGTQTLAWLWNQSSNQVVKLSSKDTPRINPYIRYLPSQDRYLAFEDDFVARLPAFAEILEAKGSEVLKFD
ncbi:hypothetical protein [Pseudomonas sp. JUb42]|uniref:hypothetical protein n=1 Tax=Pseudomonas sp. JUb42 TaxID=2940611 RepID=UPI0021693F36|nr:hypothetical protein [Pseudomonas sp. JUb42]